MNHHPELGQHGPEIRELSNSRPLARVEHSCIICGTPIAIGQKYFRNVVYDSAALSRDRRIRVFKYHIQCPIEALPPEGSAEYNHGWHR